MSPIAVVCLPAAGLHAMLDTTSGAVQSAALLREGVLQTQVLPLPALLRLWAQVEVFEPQPYPSQTFVISDPTHAEVVPHLESRLEGVQPHRQILHWPPRRLVPLMPLHEARLGHC